MAISVQEARTASETARALADDHDRAYRDADPADAAIAARGSKLRQAALDAAAAYAFAQRAANSAGAIKRRAEQQDRDSGLQARLRAESQERRDAAAHAPPAPKRLPRGRP